MATFEEDMEKARKAELGEGPIPVVKLTGRFVTPENSTWHHHAQNNEILNKIENLLQSKLVEVFEDLEEYEISDADKRGIIGSVEVRLDMIEEWDGWKDNQDPEIPGQDERDYPQSFLE